MTTKTTPKGKHGGARPGAGRPTKPPQLLPMLPVGADPLAFLLAVMNCPEADIKLRIDAAKAALPYRHARMTAATTPSGTRPQQGAGQVFPAASRFRPSQRPEPKH